MGNVTYYTIIIKQSGTQQRCLVVNIVKGLVPSQAGYAHTKTLAPSLYQSIRRNQYQPPSLLS